MTMYRKSSTKNRLQPVRSAPFGKHYLEEDLETLLEQNPDVLAEGEPLLVISRQPNAQESGMPDLLALDADGNVVIVELKRGRAPRDVIAQALEYAAWAAGLDQEAVMVLAGDYLARRAQPTTLAAAWQEAFGQSDTEDDDALPVLPPDLALNGKQRIILVLEGRDDRIRIVVDYLRRHGIEINIVEYLYYRTDSGEEFLDIEAVHTPQETAQALPSESGLLATWPQEAQNTYLAIKETLLGLDETITIEPRKSGISFYKRTRGGRVFIGTVYAHKSSMTYSMRRDSLEGRLDVAQAEAKIKNDLPNHLNFWTHSENSLTLGYPMRPEDGRTVARLILDHIANKLD
jgi:hypothetical protein